MLVGETGAGTPLLVPLMRNGQLLAPLPSLGASREHAGRQLACLPDRLRPLDAADPYRVAFQRPCAHSLPRSMHPREAWPSALWSDEAGKR
jgi:nicotinate phosphoribosyltransferase